MLRRTFQLIRGVGPARERELWARGIRCWDEFPPEGGEIGLSPRQDPQARNVLAQARDALAARDLAELGALLPPREHWRLFPEFASEAVYFDIETDGRYQQRPTVVSLFHREGFEVFIDGRNLDDLPARIARWPMWVTFNGASFDVPVLRTHFGGLFPHPAVHLDLRHVCRRFGLRGGLKKLEDQLGFGRPPHLRGVDGYDAVLLWRAYKESVEVAALRILVEYNLYDSIQLRTLAEATYNRALDELTLDEPRLRVFERGEVLYDVSRYLLELGPSVDDQALIQRLRARERNLQEM